MNEIIKIENGKLLYDFTTLEAHIVEEVDKYSGLQFTEETKKDAKAAVAELRKEQKDLQAKVKEVKAAWMQPFEEFEAKAFAIISKFNEPINAINGQVTEFESKRKQEKQEHIKAIYDEVVPEEDIQSVMPLLSIYDTRWENATCNDKQIRSEMLIAKEATKSAIITIKAFKSDKEADALAKYKITRDLAASINVIQSYEEVKRQIEERRAQKEKEAEIERAKQEAIMAIQIKNEAYESLTPDWDSSEVYEYRYAIKLNNDAKEKLEAYMDSVGIEWEVAF